jgi:hypothetical protein
MAKELNVPRNGNGQIRVSGVFLHYGTKESPARVWIGIAAENPLGPIFPDTVLKLRDAHGNTDEILAGEEGVVFG